MKFFSQGNQDKWVSELFDNKSNFFIDIGALDGIEHSNTYALEKYLGWSGICIEANKSSFDKLKNNRNSININCAIQDYDGFCKINGEGPGCKVEQYGEDIECFKLNTLLEKISSPTVIDYLSIDIEGSEYAALSSFDFEKYFIKAITLEHNYYFEGDKNKNILFDLLSSKGFIRVVDNALCLDSCPKVNNQPYEDWYINSKCMDLLNNPNSKLQPKN